MKKVFYFSILLISLILNFGCKNAVNNNLDEKIPISGKAYYQNVENSENILVSITSTDTNKKSSIFTYTDAEGNYSFEGVAPGTYTICASSENSVEKSVYTNITVSEDEENLVPDLILNPTGTLSGTIILDGSAENNGGFLVTIAGTSYLATTNSNGYFEIMDVPAGTNYEIQLIYNLFVLTWKNNVEVKGLINTELEKFEITTDQIKEGLLFAKGENGSNGQDGSDGKDGNSIIWKGSFESADQLENPQYLWAYFNTVDGCSYIFDGEKWTLLADKGDKGEPTDQYVIRTTKIASGDPNLPAGGLKIEILKNDNVIEVSYIANGTSGVTYINYELDGGSFSQKPTVDLTFGNKLTLAKPNKDHYTFMGWYNNNSFSGEEITEVKSDGTKSTITLYAKFLPNLQVTYETNGGTFTTTPKSEFKVGETLSTIINPKKEHFTFMGWYSIKNFSGEEVKELKSDGSKSSVTLYAKWLPNMQVTFETNGGTFATTPKSEFEVGENVIIIPKKEHFTFMGWYFENDFSGKEIKEYKSNGTQTSITLYAKWLPNLQVIFETNDGTFATTPKSEFEVGENVIIIPKKEHFTFMGWYFENDFSGKEIKELVSDGSKSSVTLYAKWLPNMQVSFETNGGTFTTTPKSEFEVGESLETIIPEKESYVFMGWYYEEDFSGNVVYKTKYDETNTSIKLYAKWTFGVKIPLNELRTYLNTITPRQEPYTLVLSGDIDFSFLKSILKNVSNGIYINLVLPDSVTSIGNSAFYGCDSLTSITIPNSITSIGDYAFSYCSNLISITIPDSVTSISNHTFYNCNNLTKIIIDSDNPKYDSRNNCNAIIETATNTLIFGCKETVIPDSVTSIGGYAFEACSNFTSITIPNNVISISSNAFYNCNNLTKIVIDSGNPKYDSRNNCNAIIETATNTLIFGCKETVIPDSVTSIGGYAFSGCSNLTSITIPTSVTSIEDSAFSGCSNLTSITIPGSVISIGNSAFYGCDSLTSITIQNGVTSIGDNAFYYCEKLSSIDIPNSVISIGEYVFSNCQNLASITIPNKMTSIGKNTFNNIPGLTSIIIPSNVTSIGDYAFYYCENLGSIIIQDGVTSIGDSAFSGCSNLTSITIPDSVTSIGESAFYQCNSLSSITIPNSITSIKGHTFNSCESITSFIIPSSITSIGNSAFFNCNKLSSITIPSSVTSIGTDVFGYCDNLTQIIVDSGNQKYDSRNNCNAIIQTATNTLVITCQGTVIPSDVTSIGKSAFSYNKNLTSFVIPLNITSIGESAFYRCSNLTSITFPSSITSIGYYAFERCYNLSNINYYGSKSQWDKIYNDSICIPDTAVINFNYIPPTE